MKAKAAIDTATIIAPDTTDELPVLKDFTYTVHIESSASAEEIERLHEMSEKCVL